MCLIARWRQLQELRDALLPSDKKGSLGVDIASFRAASAPRRDTGDRPDVHILRHTVLYAARPVRSCGRCLVVFFDARDDRLRTLKIMNDIRAQSDRLSERGGR